MQPSDACINLVKQFEGCELAAYQDVRGIWTIGYGHRGLSVVAGMTIDQQQADMFLVADLSRAAQMVEQCTRVIPNQNQYDALVDFEFNTGGLLGSTLLRLWNNHDESGAADQFLVWDKAEIDGELQVVPGLTRRREAERTLFLTPMVVTS